MARGRGILVNISRTKVDSPSGSFYPARFVFHNGRAAVWMEDKKTRSATRVLYSEDATLTKPNTARVPMTVLTTDGQEWTIKQNGGGCGCGSPLKKIPLSQLLDPDFTST